MTKKKTPKRKPVKPGKTGVEQDKATGQFLPGNNGGSGRPPGIDVRQAALASAKKAGVDLAQAVGNVLLKMVEQALDHGDVAAAKLVLDRLCGPVEPAPVQVNIDNRPPPTGPADGDWASHFAKLIEVQRSIAAINGPDRGA